MTTILTALYLDVLRPTDRVAVKPHKLPLAWHRSNHSGMLTRE